MDQAPGEEENPTRPRKERAFIRVSLKYAESSLDLGHISYLVMQSNLY